MLKLPQIKFYKKLISILFFGNITNKNICQKLMNKICSNFFMAKYLSILFILLSAISCGGFYKPITLSDKVPPGPPEYQAGWRSGCRSGITASNFRNSFGYNFDYGNGVYHGNKMFSSGWSHGWFSCILAASTFVDRPAMDVAPLE